MQKIAKTYKSYGALYKNDVTKKIPAFFVWMNYGRDTKGVFDLHNVQQVPYVIISSP